ncbi:MAG: uroporphyrinogen-III synthase [Pseudomonadota bacterium]|nr:uroporphyrinogen-III synthase [Pseudomonadota bacterium]
MRLLVTRPAADAQALAAELEARGHSVICAPVIEIVTKPDAAPELTNVKGLAFTSANGVRAFGPFAPVARQMRAYAVGPQTAAALAAIGFTNVRIAGGDVVSLANTITDDCPEGPILHISGRDQAGDLVATLKAAGCAARRAVLYEARAATSLPPTAVVALRDKALDGVILYSKRSAEIFYRLAGAASLDASVLQAFCLSAGVGDIARAAGATTHVAGFPDDVHIFNCIDAAADS